LEKELRLTSRWGINVGNEPEKRPVIDWKRNDPLKTDLKRVTLVPR